jgi:hypothetical protein
MPIVIWGSRGLSSTVEHGEFYCPRCDRSQEYALKQIRPWFTLYFIPIFPIGGAQRYVECRACGQGYKEEVLDYRGPSEADRLLTEVYQELKEGTSVDALERRLISQGMSQEDAAEVLTKMCDGRPQQCRCGQRLHPDVRECKYCGGNL